MFVVIILLHFFSISIFRGQIFFYMTYKQKITFDISLKLHTHINYNTIFTTTKINKQQTTIGVKINFFLIFEN